ncbi:MAG TPA: choice-of-anchor L domain-containing protein, partial [Lacipirellulaceae bacterium]|nr:choice-of-anchor L domain-containing protein [Lacipirellulaceae bacterium]
MANQTLVDTGALDLVQGNVDPAAELISALVQPNSGISVVPQSAQFVGRVGNIADANTAQSALLNDAGNGPFQLVSFDSTLPTVAFPTHAILMTNGLANIPSSNTNTEFDHRAVNGTAPGGTSTSDVALLRSILGDQNKAINDVNSLKFSFTVPANGSSVEADFVFGSDEYPETDVTDIFAFVVDGKNYAVFADNSLVSFQKTHEQNFNSNTTNAYGIEYDGISNKLH